MRRCAAFLLVALLAVPATSKAQSGYWWVGAGAMVPTGDAADVVSTGWMGTAGLGLDISSVKGLSVQGEFLYGSNSVKSGIGTGNLTQTGFIANVEYAFSPDAEWNPYVYAGYGIVSSKASAGGSSDSNGAFNAAAGLSYKYSPKLNIWGEARYMSISTTGTSTNLIPITIGISMPFGTK